MIFGGMIFLGILGKFDLGRYMYLGVLSARCRMARMFGPKDNCFRLLLHDSSVAFRALRIMEFIESGDGDAPSEAPLEMPADLPATMPAIPAGQVPAMAIQVPEVPVPIVPCERKCESAGL